MSISSAVITSGRMLGLAAFLFVPAVIQAQDYGQQSQYPPQQYPQQGDYNQSQGDPSQADPPSRVARVSVLQGNVSLQPSGVEDFSPANLNYPLTSGDRLYSDNGATAELEIGGAAVRLGSATDLSVTSMTDQVAQFGLGQGSVHVRTYDFDPNSTLEVDTPNVAVTVLAPGDLRVDVTPDGTMTQVTLLSGQARVDGPGFQQQLQPGESMQLTGTEPVYSQDVRRPRTDNFDRFSQDRDNAYQSAIAVQSDYINADTIGAADLGQYGDWSNDGDYGPVWYPRGVAVDWQPYSFGHWAYIAPWGWTWVENEPWGFAPFHYGRWARFGPRWGWIPGPRVVRPVYSPALVAFVGGGAGVTAWFPLGPREPYTPWYRSSSLYANRVNVTNIYSRNTVEVRNIYNQRTSNVYVNNTTVNRVFVNRQVATVAVPQNTFAGGRPVHETAMRVPPQQLANAPVLAHPIATPTRQIMAPAPARALPPRINRPPVESRAPANQPGGMGRPGWPGNPNGVGATGPQGNGNRPGGFGTQPGAANGNVPPGTNNAPHEPGNVGQRPVPGQPVRSITPFQPQPGAPQQGSVHGVQSQPSPGVQNQTPFNNQPVAGQPYNNRGQQTGAPQRVDEGRPGVTNPNNPGSQNQFPNRGNEGNGSWQRGTPGQNPPSAAVPPVQQPVRGNPPQAPSVQPAPPRAVREPFIPDQRPQAPTQIPHGQPGASPVAPQPNQNLQPSGNPHQWQQQNGNAQQVRPQMPEQTPHVPPTIAPQRAPAPPPQHQLAPPPAARQPAPPPNKPQHDDDKKH